MVIYPNHIGHSCNQRTLTPTTKYCTLHTPSAASLIQNTFALEFAKGIHGSLTLLLLSFVLSNMDDSSQSA